jgi:ribosomal protein S18 acetylase RimI-like enzyme
LLVHVRDFWRFEKLPWESSDVRGSLGKLLASPALGRVFIAQRDGEIIGYTVLAFGYSLEHQGRDALVDELYVVPAERGQGVGSRLLDNVGATCRALGIVRVHLEVDDTNPRAQSLYERFGFSANNRFLLTKKIAPQP